MNDSRADRRAAIASPSVGANVSEVVKVLGAVPTGYKTRVALATPDLDSRVAPPFADLIEGNPFNRGTHAAMWLFTETFARYA